MIGLLQGLLLMQTQPSLALLGPMALKAGPLKHGMHLPGRVSSHHAWAGHEKKKAGKALEHQGCDNAVRTPHLSTMRA